MTLTKGTGLWWGFHLIWFFFFFLPPDPIPGSTDAALYGLPV